MPVRLSDLSPDARARLGLLTPSRRKRVKRGIVVVTVEQYEAVQRIRHRLCMIAAALSPRPDDIVQGCERIAAELAILEGLRIGGTVNPPQVAP